jgi:hypothetical protein
MGFQSISAEAFPVGWASSVLSWDTVQLKGKPGKQVSGLIWALCDHCLSWKMYSELPNRQKGRLVGALKCSCYRKRSSVFVPWRRGSCLGEGLSRRILTWTLLQIKMHSEPAGDIRTSTPNQDFTSNLSERGVESTKLFVHEPIRTKWSVSLRSIWQMAWLL